MTTPADADTRAAEDALHRETGRKLFAGQWEFVWASTKIDNLPPMLGHEIAFAGRSNVGKSSLINALTGRKGLARTSNTPGRTQELIFFRPETKDPVPPLTVVDMPGYGYAAVGKAKVAGWTQLIHDYLRGRANLARVYVLIDARHGVKDTDKPVLDLLDKSAVSYQLVLTKADALRVQDRERVVVEAQVAIARRTAAHPEILLTSSEKDLGIAEMRGEIARLLSERSR